MAGMFNMGGDSKTENTTYQYDNRQVLGEGALDANNSNVTVTTNNLGGDVVDSSLNFARDAVDSSLLFGAVAGGAAFGLADSTLNFAGDALNRSLNTVDKTTDSALSFGADAMAGAFGFGNNALRANADLAGQAIGFADRQTQQSTQIASDSISALLQGVSQSLANSFNLSQATQDGATRAESLVSAAYSDAQGRGALTDWITIGALVAVAFVAWQAVKK